MAVPVDIVVVDTTVAEDPISGVTVGVYDVAGALVAQGTTDDDGEASFLLPGAADPGEDYEVRFYKAGVLFDNPKTIQVLEPLDPGETNIFDMSGTLQDLPVAVDPRLCRCTGVFIGFDNLPRSGLLVRVSTDVEVGGEYPRILDGRLLSISTKEILTDEDGQVSIDLIRGGKYVVNLAWEEDQVWLIEVPDRSSVNLVDLIHPYPASLDFSDDDAPGDALSVEVGETKEVQASVLFTDFITRTEGLSSYIEFSSSNENVDVTFHSATGKLSILGKEAGTTEITASILEDLEPIRVPAPPLTTATLVVTVTA